jgi:DhnA family fructose-bisphosphate aldolase class Ia
LTLGKELRKRHILREDGKTLIVAMDHGMFGNAMPGLEDPGRVIKEIISGGADAIMTTTGIIEKYQNLIAGNLGVVWSIPNEVGYAQAAAKMGADAIKLTYFVKVKEIQKIHELSQIAGECETWGIPLLVEMVPIRAEGQEQPTTSNDPEELKQVTRCVSEQGGDIVKTNYTGDESSFREVVRQSLIPVVILGGPKMKTDSDVLRVVKESADAGGAGVAFGRNILQHRNPRGMVRAISEILHEGSTVDKALKNLG